MGNLFREYLQGWISGGGQLTPNRCILKGDEDMYITLNDIIQLLMLLCEVVTVLLLALSIFKSNKK